MDSGDNLNIPAQKLPNQTLDISKSCSYIAHNNVIHYDFYKRNRTFNLFNIEQIEIEEFRENLKDCFEILIDKERSKDFPDIIKKCFEISCYILYDRQILDEVIEKQKNYEIEYIVDFFRYVLRIFFRRYGNMPMLTKSQCDDVRNLCEKILSINNCEKKYSYIIHKLSAKDIVRYLQTIIT